MTTHKDHLKNSHQLETVAQTQAYYTDWAQTYDAELTQTGYASPMRCAKALAGFTPEQDLALLDVGCGTGLSGVALQSVGFTRIDGCDINPDMLELAKKRAVYDMVWQSDLDDPLPFEAGRYDAISAIGVIGAGAAPVSLIYLIFEKLASGGLFTFSFNDGTLQDPEFEAAVMNQLDFGAYELLFKEYGDHLPGKGMKSNVYVMRKR